MFLLGRLASSKKHTQFETRVQKPYSIRKCEYIILNLSFVEQIVRAYSDMTTSKGDLTKWIRSRKVS